MSASYPERGSSRRPFVVTPYVEHAGGRMAACMPSRCPAGAEGRAGPCSIATDHRRVRKSGPPFPLVVARCRKHGVAFTLYPPGFAPYRRQAVLRLGPDGSALAGADTTPPGRVRSDFDSTLFEAALDAEQGRPWARDPGELGAPPPERWWSTQKRHLLVAAKLLGLSRGLAERIRASIAAILSVELLALSERAELRGYRALGRGIRHVLERLRGGARRAMSLLACGHQAGLWGEPLHWDRERGVFERSPFCVQAGVGGG